jgi:hypothetical protein
MYIKPGPGRFGVVRTRRVQLQLGQQVTVAGEQALLHLGISQQSPLPLVGYGNLVPARRTAYHSLGSDRASIVRWCGSASACSIRGAYRESGRRNCL